jgi:hypothetical protein
MQMFPKLGRPVRVATATLITVCAAFAQHVLSPREVLERYCQLDGGGAQITAGGWHKVARMFLPNWKPGPGPLRVDILNLVIIQGFTIGDLVPVGSDKVKFTVRYSSFGEIGPMSFIFARSTEQPLRHEESNYSLVFTTEFFDLNANDEEVRKSGPKSWRIEGLPPSPHITIDAAIRYLPQFRDKQYFLDKDEVRNSASRANLKATIETLRKLRSNFAGPLDANNPAKVR